MSPPRVSSSWQKTAIPAVAAAVLAALGMILVVGGGWFYHHGHREFLRAVHVGMAEGAALARAGPPAEIIPAGRTLTRWGGHPARVFQDEAWVYYFGPGHVHRITVLMRQASVVKIIFDGT
jgi:hypothetical protein